MKLLRKFPIRLDELSSSDVACLIDLVYEMCDRLFLYLSDFGRAVSVPEQFYAEGRVPATLQIPLTYVEGTIRGTNPLRVSANPRVDPIISGNIGTVPYVESIVLDIDSDETRKSIETACRFAKWLEKELGVVSQVMYTGRNACLRIFVRDRLPSNVYEKVWNNIAGLLLVHAPDIGVPRSVMIDPRSSSAQVHVRVPYSGNEKSRTIVQVLDYSCSPLEPKDIDVPWNSRSIIEQLLHIKLSIDVKALVASRVRAYEKAKSQIRENSTRHSIEMLPRSLMDVDLNMHPPCIRQILEELLSGGHPSHEARFTLASYMLRICVEALGRKIEECVREAEEFFKHAGDYRPEKTRYQLCHIGGLVGKKTFYMVPNCETLKKWGLCPMDASSCGVANPLTYIFKRLRGSRSGRRKVRAVAEDDYGGVS